VNAVTYYKSQFTWVVVVFNFWRCRDE